MLIEKFSQTVFTPLDNGRGVLLNLETLRYYNLNRTGAAVWQLIDERSSLSLDDIVKGICERFEVEEEPARIDLRAFVEHLARFKMVRTND
ncbi:MAG TPA: PqqD family protein [Blastocatellia bacterium]|nr:PqqD family protein [Blastocatellia bacterium]